MPGRTGLSECNGLPIVRLNLDLVAKFSSLEIDGCETGILTMLPESQISIEISKFDIANGVSYDCELRFLGLLDATVRLVGTPWLGLITAHHASGDSSYLTERRDCSYFLDRLKRQSRDMKYWNEYYHFSITFEESSIEAIAQDFVFYIVATRPVETDFQIP